MTRPLTVLAALTLLVAACGSGSDTTTTTGSTSTTTPTTVPEPPEEVDATAFYFSDTGGNGFRSGPFLIAVDDPTAAAGVPELEALLDGPPDAAAEAGITSEIPDGTAVEMIEIGPDGVAIIELTDTFDDGGGTASMTGRLAQLTYTLTARDDVDSVLLMENGAVVEVFSNEGIVLDGPMVRSDFEDLLPGILVEKPAWGASVTLPFTASGTAAVFEAVFQMQVLVGDDVVFEPPFVTTDNGMGFGSFQVEIDADVVPPTQIALRVWEFSAEDGSVVNERVMPLVVAAE